jgi:NADH:ubiquinone oxidoreductase subunit F (NADH-binding)
MSENGSSGGLPRLLAGISPSGALTFDQHLEIHGELPVSRRRERRGSAALIDQIEQAGLLGRGGASFPTALKMRAVASARGRPVIVINAAEGEPASLKDSTLIQSLPHLAFDGATVAAAALGAEEIILCVGSRRSVFDSAAQAIGERQQLLGSSPRLRLAQVPDRYVSGQESALVNHLNGGEAKPTFTPPMPFQSGVRGCPTLVSNAETFAHIGLIARHGPEWFRSIGTASQPGSALVTLTGPLAYPGVYEIEHGTSLASLIDAAGGLSGGVSAVLCGGYSGAWVDGGQLNTLSLSNEDLAPYGASLGPGVVLLLSEQACPVSETARLARWLASESTRQCGPCIHGLDTIATVIERVRLAKGERGSGQHLARLVSMTSGRGACAHPDGAVKVLASAFEVFSEEFVSHSRYGRCEACEFPPELPYPGVRQARADTLVPAG